MNKANNKGFSLIEIILYLGLAALVLSSFTFLSLSWLNLESKTEAVSRLNTNSLFALQTITHLIKNAQTITVPAAGKTSRQIELTIDGLAGRIYQNQNKLYYSLATASPEQLIETSLRVDNFLVSRASSSGQNKALKINLSLSLPQQASGSWQTVVCQR